MSRRKEDDVDVWCNDWAKVRRFILGLGPLGRDGELIVKPHERLGKLRCTLAQVREEGEGAGHRRVPVNDSGHVQQSWPEVYRGMALEVQRAQLRLPCKQREVLLLHYVWREIPVVERCELLGFAGASEYYYAVRRMKIALRAVVVGSEAPARLYARA